MTPTTSGAVPSMRRKSTSLFRASIRPTVARCAGVGAILLALALWGCSERVTSGHPQADAARVRCRETGTPFDAANGATAYVIVYSDANAIRANEWILPICKCSVEFLR